MKIKLIPVFLLLSLCMQQSHGAPEWQWRHKKLSGVYGVYGGELGDPVAPSRQDSKIMFAIDGQAAKELFDAIGPDIKDQCTAGTKIRMRMKDQEHLSCQRSENAEYFCNFGFDLRTGKSIGGVVC